MKVFCCLKVNGRPRSSSFGPMKMRTVPFSVPLLRLLTTILYVKSAWFKWVNLASTAPRGVKSSPRDKSTSLLVQNVLRTFCCWSVITLTSAISTPGKSNCKEGKLNWMYRYVEHKLAFVRTKRNKSWFLIIRWIWVLFHTCCTVYWGNVFLCSWKTSSTKACHL